MVITIALGVALGAIALGVLRVVIDYGMTEQEPRAPRPPSQRALARCARLAAKINASPCYMDSKGNVHLGLRHWK